MSQLLASFRTVGGVSTRVIETKGAGPTLLLFHGFSDSADTWRPVLEQLAREKRRAVAVDLPGHGNADPLDDEELLAQLDRFVLAAVAEWTENGRAPILVGNSLGGVASLIAAQCRPATVAGVVPVSPAGFEHASVIRAFQRVSIVNPLMFVSLVPMPVYRRLAARAYGFAGGGGTPMVPGVTRTYASHFARRSDVRRLLGVAPRILAEIDASTVSMAPIEAPMLILWGKHDRLTLVAGAERLRTLGSDVELQVLDDCGHCPQMQSPEQIAGHLVAFQDRFQDRLGTKASEATAG